MRKRGRERGKKTGRKRESDGESQREREREGERIIDHAVGGEEEKSRLMHSLRLLIDQLSWSDLASGQNTSEYCSRLLVQWAGNQMRSNTASCWTYLVAILTCKSMKQNQKVILVDL